MDAMMGVTPLTPLAMLDRAADYFPNRTAYRFEGASTSYDEFREQVRRLAAHLTDEGVRQGDRVAVLAHNVPLALLAHFAVPYAGATLVALNHRLADRELHEILEHAEPRLLLAQTSLEDTARASVPGLDVPVVADHLALGATPDAVPQHHPVTDELSPITINYTSGTTGSPKGVTYRHRGAYLQALAMAYHLRLELGSVYLWTLPMFHCNGWAFPWAVAAAGATSLCTDTTDPERLWELIRSERVTHFCAAPTLLTSLLTSPGAARVEPAVTVATGGAPPTPALIRRAEELGLHVIHLYGLTETYGPSLLCEWQPEWDSLGADEQADRLSRQGIPNITAPSVRLARVPGDGTGREPAELTIDGNTVMAGYYRDDPATSAASDGGTWFRTGDLVVQHDDRYYQLQDRAKDIIISGGENISSVEVERALAEHPAVSESAVVARPDEKWGEVPVAYVSLTSGEQVSGEELIEFVRSRIAHFKAPKEVVFGDLPKTGTGKIQKFELRQRASGD